MSQTKKQQKKDSNFYLITYRDPRDGQIQTLKAGTIRDSSLGLSFVTIADFIFETSGVIANPIDEQQRQRFEKVKSLHLSIYSIISIEEIGMEHKGLNFKKDKSNLVAFPNAPTPLRPS